MKKKRVGRGFTLLEMMVVVLVILLLVGILLPAVSRAREKTRRSVCAANLKQIGLAILLYAGDNGSYCPNVPKGNSFSGIQPKITETTTKLFSCPSASNTLTAVNNSNFTYVGKGLKDDNATNNTTSLAYDTSGNHPSNKWMNLLFLDGHVEGDIPGVPPNRWRNN